MGSETTAAATHTEGVIRRDPMAMLPFCGYNMADYFHHWLDIGKRLTRPPKVFSVNWFRVGADGEYLWPGFGENIRVLKWIIDRTQGKVGAQETPIGLIPHLKDLNLDGLKIPPQNMKRLFEINPEEWRGARRRASPSWRPSGCRRRSRTGSTGASSTPARRPRGLRARASAESVSLR